VVVLLCAVTRQIVDFRFGHVGCNIFKKFEERLGCCLAGFFFLLMPIGLDSLFYGIND
jgi:hypothetical protein